MAAARYLGTTGGQLAEVSRIGRWWGVLDARTLFPRRGALSLFDNRIVLAGWERHASVTVHARELGSVGLSSPVGGVRPIALRHRNGETLYLVINRRWLPGRDDNAEWVGVLRDWFAGCA